MFRDKLFDTTDMKVLYELVIARKHWNKLNPEILRRIFANSGSELTSFGNSPDGNEPYQRIHRLILMSEMNRLVQTKMLELVDNKDPENGTTRMASILNAQGDDLLYQIETSRLNEQAILKGMAAADMSYQAAILCDPFYLGAHCSLARMYLNLKKTDWAAYVCKLYDVAEDTLFAHVDSSMNYSHDVLRNNQGGVLEEMRTEIDRIRAAAALPKAERREAPVDTTSESAKRQLRESIERTQREIYPKRYEQDQMPDRKPSFCRICSKEVTPTFHGCCPECGNFL